LREVLKDHLFFDGQINPTTGLADVSWLEGDASMLCHEEWHDPKRSFFGALLDGQPCLLMLYNRGDLPQSFVLPGSAETVWSVIFDTSMVPGFVEPDSRLIEGGVPFQIKASSMACLQLNEGPAMEGAHC